MRLFITGGTGFLGRYITQAALEAGHDCICLYRSRIPEMMEQHEGIQWVHGDLRCNLNSKLSSVDTVIHLAAVGVSPQKATWKEAFQVNAIDSVLFVENAVKAGVRRVIACGSCFEYGASGERYEYIPVNAPLEPLNIYGASKAAATIALTALARNLKFSLTILRPFHVFGEGQASINLWPSLKAAALNGEDFEISPGEQIRDYMKVEDVAACFVTELERTAYVRPVIKNIGSGTPITLSSFCEYWWGQWSAVGQLKIGAKKYRENEIMRFVPLISDI